MVRNRAAGRVWVERGRKAVQIYAETRERVALFGYFETAPTASKSTRSATRTR